MKRHINKLFEKTGIVLQLLLARRIVLKFIGTFFFIFLYRVTNDFSQTILGVLLTYIGLALGYYISVGWLFRVFHCLTVTKISFAIEATTYLLIAFLFQYMDSLIFVFVFLRGIATGIYYVSMNTYQLEQIPKESRGSMYLTLLSLTSILGVILPVLSGFLINDHGYEYVFILSAVIYIFSLAIPTKQLNDANIDQFSWKEFRLMTKLKGFKLYSITLIIDTFLFDLTATIMLLVPFLLLGKSELNLGFLTGAVALTAGILGLIFRNTTHAQKYAVISSLLLMPLELILGVFWNGLAVTIRSVLYPIGDVFYSSQTTTFEFSNIQTLLGHHLNQDTVELWAWRETLLIIGRSMACGLLIGLISAGMDFADLARTIILILAPLPVMRILYLIWLDDRLQFLKGRPRD